MSLFLLKRLKGLIGSKSDAMMFQEIFLMVVRGYQSRNFGVSLILHYKVGVQVNIRPGEYCALYSLLAYLVLPHRRHTGGH